MTDRNTAITLSRITGMIFIVLCHIVEYFWFVPGHEVIGHFFDCGVPLFIFISGYLYGLRIIRNYKRFFIKRIVSVSCPAVLVSVFTMIALLIAGVSVSIPTVIAYLFDLEGLLFLNWSFVSRFFNQIDSLGPLWFTTIIMLCYLLIPLLQMVYKRLVLKKIGIFIFVAVGILICVLVKPYFELSYFLFYIIGYIAGKNELMKKINLKWLAIYSLIVCAAIIIRLILHNFFDDTELYTTYAGLSHFVLGIWFVVLYSWLNNRFSIMFKKISERKVTKTLDKYSYYIFLVHGVFCMGAFNLFELMPLHFAVLLFLVATVSFAIIIRFLSNYLVKPFRKRGYLE